VEIDISNSDEKDVDLIALPKDDINKRVDILEFALNKERKIQVLGKIKKDLKDFFDKHADKFEELELPLPTSIEIEYCRDSEFVNVEDFILYDSEDRSIDYDEYAYIRIDIDDEYSEDICDAIRECIYDSVDTEYLVNYTSWEGYRIVFGDTYNQSI
jgi:hypothetical protein